MRAYPRRAGDNPRRRALKAALARLADGVTWKTLLDGTLRYAAYIAATGKTRTDYVLQAATFFGPDGRYADDWPTPARRGVQPGAPKTAAEREEDERLAAAAEQAKKQYLTRPLAVSCAPTRTDEAA